MDNLKTANIHFPERIKNNMNTLSGFFSNDDYNMSRFCSEMVEILKNIDAIAVWNYKNKWEQNLLEKYAPNAKLISLGSLGDYVGKFESPWTQCLKGKKVLVIHPFEKTIIHQYQKREKLFKNPLTLPEFELKTLKAVQGLGGGYETKQYKTWFEALNSMYKKIDEIDFDVALIGAGAYGMFLANYVKELGKQAIHIGGATQLLFGIKGDRWLVAYGDDFHKDFINDEWIYPLKEDTPNQEMLKDFTKGEGGICAYWKADETKQPS